MNFIFFFFFFSVVIIIIIIFNGILAQTDFDITKISPPWMNFKRKMCKYEIHSMIVLLGNIKLIWNWYELSSNVLMLSKPFGISYKLSQIIILQILFDTILSYHYHEWIPYDKCVNYEIQTMINQMNNVFQIKIEINSINLTFLL